MYSISPVRTKEEQKELAEYYGVPYLADCLAYAAVEEGKRAGFCQFRIGKDAGVIHTLCPAPDYEQFEIMFIMARTALNFIDLCGIHRALFLPEVTDKNRTLLRALGFLAVGKDADDTKKLLDLTHYFEHHCESDTASAPTVGDKA